MRELCALVALATFVAVLHTPARSDACSAPAELHRAGVQPADLAEAVPTNTEIRIAYEFDDWFEHTGDLDDVVVRSAAGGEPVEVAIEMLRTRRGGVIIARPLAPLAPSARYEILDGLDAEGWCASPDTCLAEPAVFATFTTGDAEDHVAPAFAGLAGVSFAADTCEGDACCGPYSVMRGDFSWPSATDDGPAGHLSYNLYGPDGGLVLAFVTHARGHQTCAGSPMGDDEVGYFEVAPGPWSVRAVDLAGNEDDNEVVFEVGNVCAQGDGDDDPDADAEGVDDPAAERHAGCAVVAAGASRSRDPAAVALALLVAAALCPRRR